MKISESVHASLVSFAGMTLDKCIDHRIWMLTGCPLCRQNHHLCSFCAYNNRNGPERTGLLLEIYRCLILLCCDPKYSSLTFYICMKYSLKKLFNMCTFSISIETIQKQCHWSSTYIFPFLYHVRLSQ